MKRSECRAVAPLLMPWKSGELSWWTALWVGIHVRFCPYCEAECQRFRQMDALLRAVTPFGEEKAPTSGLKPGPIAALSATVTVLVIAFLLIAPGRFPALRPGIKPVPVARIPGVRIKPGPQVIPQRPPVGRSRAVALTASSRSVAHHPRARASAAHRLARRQRRTVQLATSRAKPPFPRRHFPKPSAHEVLIVVAEAPKNVEPEESLYIEWH